MTVILVVLIFLMYLLILFCTWAFSHNKKENWLKIRWMCSKYDQEKQKENSIKVVQKDLTSQDLKNHMSAICKI